MTMASFDFKEIHSGVIWGESAGKEGMAHLEFG